MHSDKKFVCAVNCMDGRTQEVVAAFLKKWLAADYVDMVTEPGPNRILAENTDKAIVANIRKRIGISVEKHGAGHIAIVGHAECAGNPVPKEEQVAHLKAAKETVKSFGFQAEIVLLWVENDWETVEEIF